MLEKLIECFKERRMRDAELILKRYSIHDILPQPKKFKRKGRQEQELNRIKGIEANLMHAIYTYVHYPRTIHALLVAGFSPIQLALLFYNDERFNIVLKFLPFIDADSIDTEELEESVYNNTNARRHDVREILYRGTPYFPIEYLGNTYDFEIVIECLKKGIKLSSDAENKPENIAFIPCLYKYLKSKERPNQERSSYANLNGIDLFFFSSAAALIAFQLLRIYYLPIDKKSLDDTYLILFLYSFLFIGYRSFKDANSYNYQEKSNNLLKDIYKRHHKHPKSKELLFWKQIFDKKNNAPDIDNIDIRSASNTEKLTLT